MNMNIAPSTIAMSVYNIMTLINSVEVTSSLISEAGQQMNAGIEPADVDRAIADLLERGLVVPMGKGVRLVDPSRRRVRWRNRDGDGWDGWAVQDPKRGAVLLEEAIRGA